MYNRLSNSDLHSCACITEAGGPKRANGRATGAAGRRNCHQDPWVGLGGYKHGRNLRVFGRSLTQKPAGSTLIAIRLFERAVRVRAVHKMLMLVSQSDWGYQAIRAKPLFRREACKPPNSQLFVLPRYVGRFLREPCRPPVSLSGTPG